MYHACSIANPTSGTKPPEVGLPVHRRLSWTTRAPQYCCENTCCYTMGWCLPEGGAKEKIIGDDSYDWGFCE